MGSSAIRTENDRRMAIKRLENAELPCTMTLTKGAPRSIEQNRLQRMWMLELEQQGDMTAEEYRAYCKLHFGIPILRHNEAFRQQYDSVIKGLAYEQKIEIMKEPMDFPVTRLMTTGEKKQFLDDVFTYWTGRGFKLTDPDWQGMEVK